MIYIAQLGSGRNIYVCVKKLTEKKQEHKKKRQHNQRNNKKRTTKWKWEKRADIL